MTAAGLFHFGPFVLEPAERRLTRDGRAIALTPKAFDLLVLLVERAGHAVGKDEILQALWPGRYVVEANLTKHVWLVRRALGDTDGRYIQTVSKMGYRFVGETVEAPGPAALDAPPARPVTARAAISGRTLRWASAALALAAVVAGGVWLAAGQDPQALTLAPSGSRPVLVAELSDLSPGRAAAWIGPAVQEMLGADLALGGRYRPLPDELARPAVADLPAPRVGGFGPASLAVLHRRAGAAYVVSGSYIVSGEGQGDAVRLDIAVQDAGNGATVGTVSRSGRLADLPALAAAAGADLRRALHAPAPDGDGPRLAASGPPSSEVMRHMGLGLQFLRTHDPAHARDEFLEAVTEAPDYALGYADLSQAWGALGYGAKSLAAAEQAAARAQGLPKALRLQIAAQRAAAQFDHAQAIASLRALVALDPADPDLRLRLVDRLIRAGRVADAQTALGQLRAADRDPADEARIELAAALLAGARNDGKAHVAHAQRALALARAHDVLGQIAQAELELGAAQVSTAPKVAGPLVEQALADFGRIDIPVGQVTAHLVLGNLHSDSDPARARAEYEKALTLAQAIGDQVGVASAYADLGTMLWTAGDRDGAEAATRHVLDIRRATEDRAGQAWALAALAVEHTDEAASDEAVAEFREAVALDRATGEQGHLAFTLYSLSDTLRLRGDLAGAASVCAQARAAYAVLPDPDGRGPADFECALIDLDAGHVAQAEAGIGQARTWAAGHADAETLGNADLTEGQIRMGLRQWPAAAQRLAQAEKTFARADMVTGEAVAASLLAICDDAMADHKAAEAAAARARGFRARVTERQEAFMTDIALAQWRARSGERAQAIAALDGLALDARRRRWTSWELEARLAAVQLAAPRDAARLRSELAGRAKRDGFQWVAARLG